MPTAEMNEPRTPVGNSWSAPKDGAQPSAAAQRILWTTGISVSVLLIWLLSGIASLATVASGIGTLAFFALPGVFMGAALFGRQIRKHPEGLILGSAAGVGVSAYTALALAFAFGWSITVMSLSVLVLTAFSALLLRSHWDVPLLPSPRAWDSWDYTILLAAFGFSLLFVMVPFLNIGRLTAEGHAYAWLFGFDFILRASMANSITLGLPPDYVHLTGTTLHYYLVAYVIPAFAYSATGKSVSLHQLLLSIQIGINFLFLASLMCYLRLYAIGRKTLVWALLVALAGYSYYGWYVGVKSLPHAFIAKWLPWLEISGSASFGSVSHLYQRLFLVEPQALTGLAVFIFVLFVHELTKYRIKSYVVAIVLGLALGAEFGIEGWQGLVLTAWFVLVHVGRWLKRREDLKAEYGPLVTALLVCSVLYASYFALGVYEFGSGKALSIRPFWWAFALSPVYFPVEYGPMLILSVWGILRRWNREGNLGIPMPTVVLLGLILFQIFFLTAEVLPEFGLLRGNRLLPLILLAFTALFFDDIFREGRKSKQYVAYIIVLLALPTCFTDIHATSNISDRGNVRIVRLSDFEACDWIKKNVPESAIVQSEPDYIGHTPPLPMMGPIELSLIANFGERRMVLGEGWISSTIVVNSKPIALARHRDLMRMFKAYDLADIDEIVKKYRINYLYVGTYEQQLYPRFLRLLQSDRQEFQEVYSKDTVHIFSTFVPATVASERVK